MRIRRGIEFATFILFILSPSFLTLRTVQSRSLRHGQRQTKNKERGFFFVLVIGQCSIVDELAESFVPLRPTQVTVLCYSILSNAPKPSEDDADLATVPKRTQPQFKLLKVFPEYVAEV